jgi:plasmid stabilization system protein ParE
VPSLIVQPRAQLDINDALTWYYPRNPALVPRFLAELDSIFDRISQNPAQFPVGPNLTRRFDGKLTPMEIVRHPKRDATRFDQEWRSALRARSFERRRMLASDLLTWQDRARLGVSFAHDSGSVSGSITFQDRELAPHPAELCEFLELDSVWFFGKSYAWAVHTGHENGELAEWLEPWPDADS